MVTERPPVGRLTDEMRRVIADLIRDGATAQELVDVGAAPNLSAAGQRIRRVREGSWCP